MKSTVDGSFRDGKGGAGGRGGGDSRDGKDGSIWIWPFELTEKLGEGGMAAVYRGRFVKNDTYHAVKLLPEDLTRNATALARFKREMELLKQLRHPNIVRCFGGTAENGQPFYAMELVEGGTLDDLLRKLGKRNWKTTAECGLQMCAALSCAHAQGIVHRDVKPSNFLVDGDRLKLSDFGLALIASSTKLTADDKTVGTFDYMAPEQISGGEVTPQTDVYALGCVFFEMLVGRPPFEADERVAILHQHLRSAPPRVADLVADCPPDLDVLIDDMLEKSPSSRPSGAEEVSERLQALLQGDTSVLPEKPRAPASPAAPTRSPEPDVRTPPETRRPRPAPSAATGRLTWAVVGVSVVLAVVLLRNFVVGDALAARGPGHDILVRSATNESEELPLQSQIDAIAAVGELGQHSEEAVATLVELLESDEVRVREAAATALGTAGGTAKKHTAQLIVMQKEDPETVVRTAAGSAVMLLQDSTRPSNPWWTRSLVFVGLAAAVTLLLRWPAPPAPGKKPSSGVRRTPAAQRSANRAAEAENWRPRRR